MGVNVILLAIPSIPPSVNRIWRRNPRGGMYLSKEAVDFNRLLAASVARTRVPKEWNFYSVEITLEPSRCVGDVDNYIKATLDGLTKAGFWSDDSRVARVSCEFGEIRKKNPRTLVRVSEVFKKFGSKKKTLLEFFDSGAG